ncbi:MAG: hypothetical protein KC422_22220 [Trueperaceae bacterium]|nr:hypothetical protein [Trueperaceae bacterium]
MPRSNNPKKNLDEPKVYEIRLKGQLDTQWINWFEGFNLDTGNPNETRLVGEVADQAALHHLLRKVRDLGLTLIAIRLLEFKSPTEEP